MFVVDNGGPVIRDETAFEKKTRDLKECTLSGARGKTLTLCTFYEPEVNMVMENIS